MREKDHGFTLQAACDKPGDLNSCSRHPYSRQGSGSSQPFIWRLSKETIV